MIRQKEQFLVLMNHQADIQKALTTETNASGLAEQRYGIYKESAIAAQNRLTDAWQKTWMTTMNSDGIIFIEKLVANILDGVSAMGGWIETIGNLAAPGLVSIFNAYIRIKQVFDTINSSPIFQKIVTLIQDVQKLLENISIIVGKIITSSEQFKSISTIFKIIANFTENILNSWIRIAKIADGFINNALQNTINMTDALVKETAATDALTKSREEASKANVTGSNSNTLSAPKDAKALNDVLIELDKQVKDTGDLMTKAAEGTLTFADAQALIARDPSYIDMISVQNGKIEINIQKLRELDLQKVNDNLETARQTLAYDGLNKASAEKIQQDIKSIEILAAYKNSILDGTAYAEQFAAAQKKASDEAKKAAEEALKAEKDAANAQLKIYDDEKKSADELLKLTIAMIKEEKQAEIDHLNQQKQNYDELIDKRIAALDALKTEEDYKKSLNKDEKKVSDITNQIAILSLDNSPQAKAKILKLQADLAAAQDKVNQDTSDHKLKLEKEALQKEKKSFDDSIKDKVQVIQNYLKETGKITNDALDLINNHGKETYKKLLEWNKIYGDGIDQTIIDAWNKGKDAVGNYQALIVEINNQHSLIDQLNAIDLNVTQPWKTAEAAIDSYIAKMNDIPLPKNPLIPTNPYDVTAGVTLGNGISSGVDTTFGGITSGATTGGLRIHHDGLDSGPVGGLKLKSNEELAKLLKGEIVVTNGQAHNFLHNILPNIAQTTSNVNQGGTSYTIEKIMDFNGAIIDKSVMPDLEKLANKVLEQINSGNLGRGIRRTSNLSSI